MHAEKSTFKNDQSSMSKDSKKTKIESWHAYMNYKFIFNLNYSYRAKTEAVFQNKKSFIFDFFMADD